MTGRPTCTDALTLRRYNVACMVSLGQKGNRHMIAELRTFAHENYVAGGHWIVETFADEDFAEYVEGATLEQAKARLKEYWEMIEEVHGGYADNTDDSDDGGIWDDDGVTFEGSGAAEYAW